MESDRSAGGYPPLGEPTVERLVGPPEPSSVEQTGLGISALANLALKTIYYGGELSGQEVADQLKLPFQNVLDGVLEFLKGEELLNVTGGGGFGSQGLKYVATSKGGQRAQDALVRSQYVGPAPITLEDYVSVVKTQSVSQISVTPGQIKEAFAHLVLDPTVLDLVGPAINSGRAIFIYGSPGSGKSTIAEGVGGVLTGEVFIPYAIDVGGHTIRVFDAQTHHRVDEPQQQPVSSEAWPAAGQGRVDARWVRCKRPAVISGGELTLEALDLEFDPVAKYFEAPLQMKANGGMLLIDDFGRQLVRPMDLLNRWMVPLEKRLDYLTLHTGMKIEIPFDTLILFSTNLDPSELVDEAFLRRIRHKVRVSDPTLERYRLIMERVCDERSIAFDEEIFAYLIEEHYVKAERELKGVHPRDITDQILDNASYRGIEPAMTRETIDQACASYFVKL